MDAPLPEGLILHPDGCPRCWWAGQDPLYVAYHDTEWGVPEYESRALYEKLILDGFQAGLSWITILKRREGFRAAFDGFSPEIVARYTDADIARLMADTGIIRNRAKIVGTIAGARAWLRIEESGPASRASSGTFATGGRSRPTPTAAPTSPPRRRSRGASPRP